MQQKQNNGTITVFLSITFLFIMAMLGTLIDGARLVEANALVYYAADLAATSALAQFRYDLKDRYGLFAYEDDPKDVLQQVVLQNLNRDVNKKLSSSEKFSADLNKEILKILGIEDPTNNPPFDLMRLNNIQSSQIGEPLTLQNIDEFERQIFEYVKFRAPVELFQSGISLDFTEIPKELEKAENEDEVDKEMMTLQEKLSEHHELQADYNALLGKKDSIPENEYKGLVNKIEKNEYRNITDKLENDPPSIEGLSALKGRMRSFSSKLSKIKKQCSFMLSKITELENSYKKMIDEVDEIKQSFDGSGDSCKYNGKIISQEMDKIYKSDLEEMKKASQLTWDNGSNTEKEKQKYKSIQKTIEQVIPDISEFCKRIELLEKEAENDNGGSSDEDDEEESLGEKIEKMWKSLDGYFNGMFFRGSDKGIFTLSSQLQPLIPYDRAELEANAGKKDEKDKLVEQAKESYQETKRKYTKKIPEGYQLPSVIIQEEVQEEVSAEFNKDLVSKDKSKVKEVRSKNQEKSSGLKGLFSGLGDFTLDTLDNAMLGMYAIGNFQNALSFDKEKPENYKHKNVDLSRYRRNMRNDEIKDGSTCFDDCEVEYLIVGNRKEIKNYQGIHNELTGLYFTLNYAFVRKPVKIRQEVEAIAKAVKYAIIGATLGAGSGAATIAYYATKELCYAALATMQTAHDLDRIYYGNKVPLFKRKEKDFCGTPIGGPCSNEEPKSGLPISYTDYLFIRMTFAGHAKVRARLQNLVELNMNTSGGSTDAGRPFKLENARSSAAVKVEAEMPFFFINIIFNGDSLKGGSMHVKKAASQKY